MSKRRKYSKGFEEDFKFLCDNLLKFKFSGSSIKNIQYKDYDLFKEYRPQLINNKRAYFNEYIPYEYNPKLSYKRAFLIFDSTGKLLPNNNLG